MKDAHAKAAVARLHPQFRPQVEAFINDAEAGEDIILRVIQGFRSFDEQQAIYDQGRKTPGKIVTQAKAGQSYHNYGLAVDIVPVINNGTALDWDYDFAKLEPYATKYGITWGGHFLHPDEDHFENKMGHTWQDLLVRYNAKDFLPGTQFVKI